MQALVKLNLELAQLEGKEKATATGIAGVFGAVAVALVMYILAFVFAGIAAALGLTIPLSAAMVLFAGVCAFLAMHFARNGWPPKPTQAIEEGQRTVEAVKSHV
jgi:hypothetical protein